MKTKRKINLLLTSFIILLILSGITAFPIKSEIEFLYKIKDSFPEFISLWISQLNVIIQNTPNVVLYGTDWLAFAHIIIALFFIPLFKNPIQHQINLKIGMLACIFVFPLAFICGPIRGIPFFHQIIDCSFGIIGFAFLYYINSLINTLKNEK
ncbi:MAG: hypothetical protein V4622_13710 [Bacteroidota bacterium]